MNYSDSMPDSITSAFLKARQLWCFAVLIKFVMIAQKAQVAYAPEFALHQMRYVQSGQLLNMSQFTDGRISAAALTALMGFCLLGVLFKGRSIWFLLSFALFSLFRSVDTSLFHGEIHLIYDIGFIFAAHAICVLPFSQSMRRKVSRIVSRVLTWQIIVIYSMSAWMKTFDAFWSSGTAVGAVFQGPYTRFPEYISIQNDAVNMLLTNWVMLWELSWMCLIIPASLWQLLGIRKDVIVRFFLCSGMFAHVIWAILLKSVLPISLIMCSAYPVFFALHPKGIVRSVAQDHPSPRVRPFVLEPIFHLFAHDFRRRVTSFFGAMHSPSAKTAT